MTSEPIRVVFICLGNICRSPVAEAVFRDLVERAGLADRFEIDSAGTSAYHEGEPPDTRAAQHARNRGIELRGRSRQFGAADLRHFDYLLVMDTSNLREVKRLADRVRPGAEVHLLGEFDPEAEHVVDVPDPYYGGETGFEDVHNMIERASRGLLAHIQKERAL